MEQPVRPKRLASATVGAAAPRAHARRLVAGRGRYADDLRFPRLLHAAFLRSPHAHARIASLDLRALNGMAGVAAAFDGPALAAVCKPWQTRLATWPSHRSPPQAPLATGRVLWQGQPVAIVLARTRAIAEDAVERIEVEWEPLEALADPEVALAEGAALIHPELGSNLVFEHKVEAGVVPPGGAVRRELRFSRHTGVPLESRTLVADFDRSMRQLTVHQSTQVPHQMRAVYAACFDFAEHDVRVVTPDVGGGFGVKLHVYDDEVAVCAAAVLCGRAVKYVGDRLESFSSDIHARAHRVSVSMSVDAEGRIAGVELDALVEAGAYSAYPRSSILEGLHVLLLAGAPYDYPAYHGRLRVAFQNKPVTGSYRGVGQPVACGAIELLVDMCARRAGIDPAEFRRHNFRRSGATPTGVEAGGLSHEACLDRLLAVMDYAGLRREQAEARGKGRHLGIGLATFIEQNAPGPAAYGAADVKISAQEACVLRLEPSGNVTCVTSHADQGQGVETALAQLIADELEVPLAAVRVAGGDTLMTAVGGGTFASRGLTIAGEAALDAARKLARRVAAVRDALGLPDAPLARIAEAMNYKQHLLPAGLDASPNVTGYALMKTPFLLANGIQASLVEVDPQTGVVRLLGHWVVEDCGRLVNPLLADEQIRGGVVQGLGAALYEECRYDEAAQLLNASMADYLVPMAGEMPDIVIAHVETPVEGMLLGGKGVGEAGTVGAAAAVGNAINDALAPFGAEVLAQPYTPQRILEALGIADR
jgi:carbon-monoxide dehydrogenase large subunit